MCLWMGEGAAVDLNEAKGWLSNAAGQGVAMAAENLELLDAEQRRAE